MKKKVLFRAPALTQSGYGVHSRQVFRWLMTHQDTCDVYVQALSWGHTPWFVDRSAMGGLIGDIMSRTGNIPADLDISVQVQLPNEWDATLAKFNVGVTAAVETDRCNPEWLAAVNKMDLVIVPSEHVKQVFLATGTVLTNIVVVPEAFIDEIEHAIPNINLDLETPFNFLVFGQITGNNDVLDRKNTFNTIKWIAETFKSDKDVGIILKTNCGRNSAFDRETTVGLVKRTLAEFRKSLCPKFYVLHGEMSNEEVAGLYRHPSVKALASFTRGEGYGLPLLEAAASDLPVIATNWSGHLDFLNHGKFIKIDYDLQGIHPSKVDGKVFMAGTKWAEPREMAAKKALRTFREMPDMPKLWAMELGQKVRAQYSQAAINKVYDVVFSGII